MNQLLRVYFYIPNGEKLCFELNWLSLHMKIKKKKKKTTLIEETEATFYFAMTTGSSYVIAI